MYADPIGITTVRVDDIYRCAAGGWCENRDGGQYEKDFGCSQMTAHTSLRFSTTPVGDREEHSHVIKQGSAPVK